MGRNASSWEFPFVFRGSEAEGYESVPLPLAATDDEDSVPDILTQEASPLSIQDKQECFGAYSEDFDDPLCRMPLSSDGNQICMIALAQPIMASTRRNVHRIRSTRSGLKSPPTSCQ